MGHYRTILAACFGLLASLTPSDGQVSGALITDQNNGAAQQSAHTGNLPETVNIQDAGAVPDGKTDNYQIIAKLLAHPPAVMLRVPSGVYRLVIPKGGQMVPAEDVVLQCDPGAIFELADTESSTKLLLSIEHNNVRIRGCSWQSFLHETDAAVLIAATGGDNFVFDDNVVDGRRSVTGITLHAFNLNNSFTSWTIVRSHFTGINYGVFRTNTSTAIQSGLRIQDNTFDRNYADNVGANAPGSPTGITKVIISGNTFSNNLYQGLGAGCAIDFANVRDAIIFGNTFENYHKEPVHIEGSGVGSPNGVSARIIIAANNFINAGTEAYADIQIIDRSQDISIVGNSFDLQAFQSGVPAINISPGGVKNENPSRVVITGNVFDLGANGRMLTGTAPFVTLTGNMIRGAGVRTGSTFSGHKATAVYFDGEGHFLATGNTVTGVSVGFGGGVAAPAKSKISSSVISNNVFDNIGTAIDATTAGAGLVVSGNAINNCVTPILPLSSPPDGWTVSENAVTDCSSSALPETGREAEPASQSPVASSSGPGAPQSKCVAFKEFYSDNRTGDLYFCVAGDHWKKVMLAP